MKWTLTRRKPPPCQANVHGGRSDEDSIDHQEWVSGGIVCPICDEPMHVQAEDDLPEFEHLAVKTHQLQCTMCGMATGRVYHSDIGYHRFMR